MCIGFLLDLRSDTKKTLLSTDQDGLAASPPDRR
jgi:hypothetical protein